MPKRASAKPAPSIATEGRPDPALTRPLDVIVRSHEGEFMRFPLGKPLQQAAMEWSRVVQQRTRWAGQDDTRRTQSDRSRATLEALGVAGEAIERLRDHDLVQVSIPFVDEATGWEARIFPWEYVLGAAQGVSRTKPFVVVRHLATRVGRAGAVGRVPPGGGSSAPARGLIIESVPAPLRDRYSFELERVLVAARLRPLEVELLPDATPEQARDHIAAAEPDLIHLAGFDSHQASALLGLADTVRDGYMMVDARGRPLPVDAEDLAAVLTVGSKLRMVACNVQNSAARVAALLVANGAEAAIGFQDRVDDATAESFFSHFFTAWQENGWHTPAAFARSLQEMVQADPNGLRGTGIVLWSAHDAIEDLAATAPSTTVPSPTTMPEPAMVSFGVAAEAGGPAPTGAPLSTQLPAESATPGVASVVESTDAVWVVKPSVIGRLNYALLHNGRPLFETFAIRNSTGRAVDGVEVEVTLFAGGDTIPYRRVVRVDGAVMDLKSEIRVPLTSALLRGVRESMRSVIHISVRRGQQVLYEDTLPVSLVPVEEWSTAASDDVWLPSFVLPRDDAVDRIVQTATALLRGLRDLPEAGFDGYQAIDPQRNDPYEFVDLQVRALWSTLAFHYALTYINPPPTYSTRAQRLRSPSSIVASRAGTCIDLALLLAACLEYIEIYPVIVLFDGHAVVGYWRGNDAHQAFQVVTPPVDALDVRARPDAGTPAGPDAGSIAADGSEAHDGVAERVGAEPAPDVPWVLRPSPGTEDLVLGELRARVSRGELSLLEATLIPAQRGFAEALEGGQQALRERRFRALIDLDLARRNGVTPLPLEPR